MVRVVHVQRERRREFGRESLGNAGGVGLEHEEHLERLARSLRREVGQTTRDLIRASMRHDADRHTRRRWTSARYEAGYRPAASDKGWFSEISVRHDQRTRPELCAEGCGRLARDSTPRRTRAPRPRVAGRKAWTVRSPATLR